MLTSQIVCKLYLDVMVSPVVDSKIEIAFGF